MKVKLTGEFIENTSITKKDGTILKQAIVLVGDETVTISKCNFEGAKRLQQVSLDVSIKNSEYGLYITPVGV